jgi:glutaredoxin
VKATINTLPDCPWCVKAKMLLDLAEIQYKEIDGKVDSYPTVPYIVIDGEPVGGFLELSHFIRKL